MRNGMGKAQAKTPAKVGRPTSLTPEVSASIINTMRDGGYLTDAAWIAGIIPATVYNWIERGEAGESPFVEFLYALKKAEAEARLESLRYIKQGGKDWQAQAWFLERRDKPGWGRGGDLGDGSAPVGAVTVTVNGNPVFKGKAGA